MLVTTSLQAATTSISALEISGTGFGTTTIRGLNIVGQATSTSNVGYNITSGCYAIGGTCVSGGSATTPGGTGTELQFRGGASTLSAVSNSAVLTSGTGMLLGLGTTTPAYLLNLASSTAPQLALSDGSLTSPHWTFRNSGGNLYISTSSPSTFATTSLSFLTLTNTGLMGIGTSSPSASFSINALSGLDSFVIGSSTDTYFRVDKIGNVYTSTSTATTTIQGGLTVSNGAIYHDLYNGQTSISNLAIGALSFDSDAGVLSWFDMPVTTASANGAIQSYTASIDSVPLLTLYSEADGSGNTKAQRVAIGTTTPYARLTVWASSTADTILEVVSSASSTKLSVSGTGFGTTTVAGLNISGSATSTSNVGFNITSGCYAIGGTCVSGGAGTQGPAGSGVGGWATSTSPDPSKLFLYPINPNTDIVVIGSNSTTTSEYWFDPNVAQSYLSGKVGIGTTTPYYGVTIASSTGPQLSLSAGAGIAQWTFRNAGGNFYISTTTVSGLSTTTISALEISGTGFGTTTVRGLNIDAQATTTSDVGFNITTGCYAINNICIVSGGSSSFIVKLQTIYSTSTPGTTNVQFTGAANSNPSFSAATLTLPSNVANYVVEGWGGGGGGGAQATNNGASGGTTCYSQSGTACGGAPAQLINATFGTGGAAAGGAPGSGGTATLGLVNLNGQKGWDGGSDGPGDGGNAPRGGAGGSQGDTGATANNGEAPGGGGGGGHTTTTHGSGGGSGAYSMNIATTSVNTASQFTVGAGGAGGAAGTIAGGRGGHGGIVITVYATSSPTAYGNDYAEMFPVSNPTITAGDIVAVDTGIPISMKLSTAGETAPLAGVISTDPGQLLGDKEALGYRPVALAGRVPTKVNLEGGPIFGGDRIAPSSVPGVGKKASQFEDSVGIALENYTSESAEGKVLVFINIQRGFDVDKLSDEIFSKLGFMVATTTDKSLTLNLNPEGKFIINQISSSTIADATTSPAVIFDSYGNAFFAGKITANGFNIGGLDDFQSQLASAGLSIANLALDASTTASTTDAILTMISDISSTTDKLNLNLETIASTTASSTPESESFADRFFGNIFARVTRWFADAANGIEKLFVKEVHTDSLCVKKSDGGEVCVTGDQIQALLLNNVSTNSGNDVVPEPASESVATSTPDQSPNDDNGGTGQEDPIATSTPPATEPIPEPESSTANEEDAIGPPQAGSEPTPVPEATPVPESTLETHSPPVN
jgi:hypothetical protein